MVISKRMYSHHVEDGYYWMGHNGIEQGKGVPTDHDYIEVRVSKGKSDIGKFSYPVGMREVRIIKNGRVIATRPLDINSSHENDVVLVTIEKILRGKDIKYHDIAMFQPTRLGQGKSEVLHPYPDDMKKVWANYRKKKPKKTKSKRKCSCNK